MVSVLLSVWFAWCLVFDVNATNETFYVTEVFRLVEGPAAE